ncbi:hypothetical protein JNB_04900 [Janibacter sp. HTCC2649]|nr:hypothetical protein JNB_04900 [Janibacter sp. HTCC2649]
MATSLGTELFTEFTSLSQLHADGWGMAWQADSEAIHSATSPDSAANDPAYRQLADTALAGSGLVHLRWATDGLDVADGNTHPFVRGELALAHNGSIAPISALQALLRPEFAQGLRGDTDSERYFRFVAQCVADAEDVDSGIIDAVTRLHAQFPNSSLNAIILAPHRLAAVHVNALASGPTDDILALYPDASTAPQGHLDRYFTMAMRADEERVLIASSGIRGAGWEPLPDNTILMVDTETLERELVAVTSSDASSPAHA